ncbi:hypothetical protein EV292_104143 [Sphingomonas sp. BK235]|nr:hypothetical protein EV292_104143 [Sphingomonas sp. BK235]
MMATALLIVIPALSRDPSFRESNARGARGTMDPGSSPG